MVDIRNNEVVMQIDNDELNTSDHLAIKVRIALAYRGNKENENESGDNNKRQMNRNWQNEKSFNIYEEILDRKLRNIKINNAFEENDNVRKKIDDYYKALKEALVSTHDEVINKYYNKNKKNAQTKWWTEEMTKLKKGLKSARMNYEMSKDQDSVDNLTVERLFRRELRRCVFIFEGEKNKNIKKLYYKPTKENFWKETYYNHRNFNVDLNKNVNTEPNFHLKRTFSQAH